MTEPGDELDARIRSLEAERLRPVPKRPTGGDRLIAAADELLRRLAETYEPTEEGADQ